MDIFGHVNNVTYFSYFDTAVNRWYLQQQILDLKESAEVFLVVENTCRYFREITFPQTVHAGIALLHLGNSSVKYRIGLFCDDDREASAEGEYVHIMVDRKTRRPVPIEATKRELLKLLAVIQERQ